MLSYTAPRLTVPQVLQRQRNCTIKNAHVAKVLQKLNPAVQQP